MTYGELTYAERLVLALGARVRTAHPDWFEPLRGHDVRRPTRDCAIMGDTLPAANKPIQHFTKVGDGVPCAWVFCMPDLRVYVLERSKYDPRDLRSMTPEHPALTFIGQWQEGDPLP